jgi:hypothetical protein
VNKDTLAQPFSSDDWPKAGCRKQHYVSAFNSIACRILSQDREAKLSCHLMRKATASIVMPTVYPNLAQVPHHSGSLKMRGRLATRSNNGNDGCIRTRDSKQRLKAHDATACQGPTIRIAPEALALLAYWRKL